MLSSKIQVPISKLASKKFITFHLLLITLFVASFLLLVTSIKADCLIPIGANPPRAEGLVSAPNIAGVDNPLGNCILGPLAPVNSQEGKILKDKARSYQSLKDEFYTRSKHPKDVINGQNWANFSGNKVYLKEKTVVVGSENLTIDYSLAAVPGMKVIFVDGNLYINHNIDYHPNDAAGGLVFVVAGDINISLDNISLRNDQDSQNVTNIDAVLISFGTICTASFPGGTCHTANQVKGLRSDLALNVNGSLISLACPVTGASGCKSTYYKFVRSLKDNIDPAESIKAQAKYLTLLTENDIMDEDLILPSE